MIEIIPAILTDNLNLLNEQIEKTTKFEASTIQIDFADGQFTESKTLLPDDLTTSSLVTSSLVTEAHLMTEDPHEYLSDLKNLDFKRVCAHLSVLEDPTDFAQSAKQIGLEIGVAINPEVKLDELEPFISLIDFVIFMTVIPGAQGKDFEEKVLDKIHLEYLHNLRNQHKNITIEVDGGVKLSNIQEVVEAGAERIVVGSDIWQASNPAKEYQALVDKANNIN